MECSFDRYPPIVALLPSGPADRVGLKVGDLVSLGVRIRTGKPGT